MSLPRPREKKRRNDKVVGDTFSPTATTKNSKRDKVVGETFSRTATQRLSDKGRQGESKRQVDKVSREGKPSRQADEDKRQGTQTRRKRIRKSRQRDTRQADKVVGEIFVPTAKPTKADKVGRQGGSKRAENASRADVPRGKMSRHADKTKTDKEIRQTPDKAKLHGASLSFSPFRCFPGPSQL